MSLTLRPAIADDASGMAAMLNRIIATGGTTAHCTPFDAERMLSHYIAPPLIISCVLALESDTILGFQALEWCDPNWTCDDKLPADWAVIATFAAAPARGRGVGRALFSQTLAAAQNAGVRTIDATIRADNRLGLAYYDAMGFTDYGRLDQVPLSNGQKVDRIRKRLDVNRVNSTA